jgi:hypothetical protein
MHGALSVELTGKAEQTAVDWRQAGFRHPYRQGTSTFVYSVLRIGRPDISRPIAMRLLDCILAQALHPHYYRRSES